MTLVARVAHHIFQIQRIAVLQAEVVADAHRAVKMHREFQLSRLVDQHAKHVILESNVVLVGWHATGAELGINRFRSFTRGIAKVQGAEISGLEFHGHATLFLVLRERLANEGLVAGQIGGQAENIFLFLVTL